MLVYKWIIKKNNEYYSLRNFQVDDYDGTKNYPPYKLGEVYITICAIKSPHFRLTNFRNSLTQCIGYHFWKEPTNPCLSLWNKYLKNKKQPSINCCLLCDVKKEDVFIENDYQLVAKRFTVINEQKIEELNNEIF